MRARRLVVTAVVLAVVAGCSSGPDEGALELDGTDASAAPPGSQPEPSDEPSSPSSATEDDEPLYPPLPELEPDPNSDIPAEEQEFFYYRYERYNDVKNRALATGVEDDAALEEVAAQGELQALRDTLGQYADDGVVLSFAESRTRWVRVVQAQGGTGIVQECRIEGPGSGRVDSSTGEAVGERTPGNLARLLQARFELVELPDGTFDHRVVEFLSAEDEDACSE